jgi:alpha-1,2-mannosyltransferase
MGNLPRTIRTGEWITKERIVVYSAILLVVGFAAIGWMLATADGAVDFKRRPIGTDYSNVYSAGKWVLEGRPEAPFSPPLQHQMEKRVFGGDTPFYGWHYPPVFLGLAALLATMPYLVSLFVWQLSTLILYLGVVRAIVHDPMPVPKTTLPVFKRMGLVEKKGGRLPFWLLPAIAFPAVFVNIGHGHNGFLTAALIGGGLLLIDRKPVIAGILIGLLCYKPQFGVMIPLVLAASGRWHVFLAASATVIAVCALTWLGFGSQTWIAFRESLEFTRTVVLEQGDTGFHKIQSPFAAVRLWGGPVWLAYAAQVAAAGTVAVMLAMLWRSRAAFALKAAALLAGALLATPYLLDYDLVVMGPAIAFFAAHGLQRGFQPYEKTLLAFVWVAPLVTRALAENFYLPLGLIALILLFGLAIRRSAYDLAAAQR